MKFKKFKNILTLSLLASCSVITHENAENYWANFSHMDGMKYYSFLREELKENSQKVMTKNEFVRFREKGYSLEDFKSYRDFCVRNGNTYCNNNIISFVSQNLPQNVQHDYQTLKENDYVRNLSVKSEKYFDNKEYFDNLSKEDGKRCTIEYAKVGIYRKQLEDDFEKKLKAEEENLKEKRTKNIKALEKFIEEEYKKSFYEKISVSLENNFKLSGLSPQQWNLGNNYIKVTSDGENVNVIKNDKLIFTSPLSNYMNTQYNDNAAEKQNKKQINKLVRAYEIKNIDKQTINKCKTFVEGYDNI